MRIFGPLWRGSTRAVKLFALLVAVVVLTIFVVRAVDSQRGPPLEPWHTFVPPELSRGALAKADLAQYLEAEGKAFAAVQAKVTQKLPPSDRVRFNRYYDASPIYPGRFAQDFNRTYVLEPKGAPEGAAVFLHGLTDSPYSHRHLAKLYADHGFVAIVLRLPGHGTVPGALTETDYEDWIAATRLAMREARRRVGPDKPVHIVGYSNGGALALMHALDALDDPSLVAPSRIVLMSPMVGVTEFARFAGLAGLPAIFPAFAKAAWLNLIPEFNPFKYNSFPVHAARQSFLLTQALQANIVRHSRTGRLSGLAPVLTFQSVLDHTVSTRAVIDELHARLDDNGSELVLFDINRGGQFEELLTVNAGTALSRLLPPAPRRFRTAVIANASTTTEAMEVRETLANATEETTRPLSVSYPGDVYSLSHVAIPFPLSDGLYGLEPDLSDTFGIRLGDIAARGEFGSLVVGMDMLVRMSSNPFFPYLAERVAAGLPPAR
ncbi:UNVERIFIED_ORG: alpha-beta hydrolase superfamily lysophospholipase [Xanthobacter viscosus]|uniref:Alpha/beta fold hydrolase n=1 Tax=Xanthobacter autotrophicus TaxID=280 RepID=A0A6C1KG23_XANAU|nr:alpha/beta fold hydrolase [Xanthobacter autotrophicus]TLX43140.1 alpha/beta fold hydrolase [Xanthobacter autotrophicus]